MSLGLIRMIWMLFWWLHFQYQISNCTRPLLFRPFNFNSANFNQIKRDNYDSLRSHLRRINSNRHMQQMQSYDNEEDVVSGMQGYFHLLLLLLLLCSWSAANEPPTAIVLTRHQTTHRLTRTSIRIPGYWSTGTADERLRCWWSETWIMRIMPLWVNIVRPGIGPHVSVQRDL